MKISYDPETDCLYISLVDRASVESEEVAPGLVLDYDEEGNVTGIDIEHASTKFDLKEFTVSQLPIQR